MRLIDADEAKKALTGWDTDPTDEEIERTIDELPTIEAAPVVHGQTEKIEPCRIAVDRQCCSCGTPMGREDNYCPNCGARMDGGGNA